MSLSEIQSYGKKRTNATRNHEKARLFRKKGGLVLSETPVGRDQRMQLVRTFIDPSGVRRRLLAEAGTSTVSP